MVKIQILGPGCYNCRLLIEKKEEAAQELGLDHELEPCFRYEPPDPADVNPQVSIAGHVVVRGTRSESAVRKAIKAQMDDW